MLAGRELTIDDYFGILRRRIWWIVVPALLGPLIAYGVSLRMQNRYTSRGLVLVEGQKVPGNFVQPVVAQGIADRLGNMEQQILSRSRLQPVIERFGLYKQDLPNAGLETLVERTRKAIAVDPVLTDDGSSRPSVTGFTVSFTYSDPATAQQVCAELVSMFMAENLRMREQSAEGTTQFLAVQLEEAKRKLDEQDAKLADFQRRYVGQLPEQEQMNYNILTSLNNQLQTANDAVNRLQQDKSYTENQLAQQLEVWNASQSATSPLTLEQQLINLQNQLASLQTRYTNDYPDVVKTRRQIDEVRKRLAATRAESGAANAEQDDSKLLQEPGSIQQLRHNIYQYKQGIAEKTREQERLQRQIRMYEGRVELSPGVNQQYKFLTRDHQTALEFYNDLLKKGKLSEIGTDLERRQQGEQFRVVDPPTLPTKPSYPNRQRFAATGLGAGLALGFGLVLLLELRDKNLRIEADIRHFLRVPVLAAVPLVRIDNGAGSERSSRWKFWKRDHHSREEATARL